MPEKITESRKKLVDFGKDLVKQIDKEENPAMDVPIRALSNVSYSEKTKMLSLGTKSSKRFFFNVAHVRKFVQTAEIAALAKELLTVDKTLSLRQAFYAIRRTIAGTNIDIVDEQEESVAPDEPLLVRLNGVMKLMSGEEIINYAQQHGKKVFDDGIKEKYEGLNLKTCAFDKNYKIKEIPVASVIKHPPNSVKKLITASGKNVKVTLSHSLFVSERGLPKAIKAGELKVGDFIAVPRRIHIDTKSGEIDIVKKMAENCPDKILSLLFLHGGKETLKDILKSIEKEELRKFAAKHYKSSLRVVQGNWKGTGIPLRLVKELNLDLRSYYEKLKITAKGSKHTYNCSIKCNKDLGVVLGFLISEGCHSVGSRADERSISISNCRKDLMELFEQSFTKSLGDRSAGKLLKSKDGTYKLNIGYDLLSYILEYALEYGPIRAWNKFVPSYLLDADEETVSSFIKWYRLGDGSIRDAKDTKQINFHTTSPKLVNGVVFLLLRFGIFSRTYKIPPAKLNRHEEFVVRIANREDVIKLSKVTGDFENTNLEKTTSFSGDRIPNVGGLVKENLDKLKMDDGAYKKFNWYGWVDQGMVSRGTLINSNSLMAQYGPVDETLQMITNYDIAWDKIVAIEDAETPPYTIDLEVPPMQNFIGGNGLIILHNSNKAIEDLELITGLAREQLHINANKNGSIAGNATVKTKGLGGKEILIDLSKMGSGGWSIPSNVEDLEFKKIDAKFILYMEKAAMWERLNEDGVWDKLNCIIISSQGQATRGIRRLLQRLSIEEKMPVYILTDFDPWGFYIYSVIKTGSISLAHASERLAMPSARFLGLTADDIEKFQLKKHLIKFKDVDLKRIDEISKYPWFKDKKEWQQQFQLMKQMKGKVELDALVSRGISFVSEKYLPEKLKTKDFLD